MGNLWSSLRHFGRLVRLSHTIFGLPFAFAAALLAHQHAVASGDEGLSALKLLWIVLAFTGARTAAMGFNRIVDRDVDAANPRTAERELATGALSVTAAITLTLCATILFVASAAALGRLPLLLSPLCVVVIFGYSLFKRFSWSSHLVLGIALALAPAGAWVAVTDSLENFLLPALLMSTVASWVAGFDVIYSLQDELFDREQGLHSIPVRFGTTGALWLSALLHVITVASLLALHLYAGLGLFHLIGLSLIALILIYEHWIVRPTDLSRIGRAFFDLNGYISIAYLLCLFADLLYA